MMTISEDERRIAILNTARSLFRANSVNSVSIDQIAQQAGIAKGTFYLYFHSKHDLLAELTSMIVEEMIAQTSAYIEETDSTPTDQLAGALAILKRLEIEDRNILDTLECPENIDIHNRANIEVVREIGPVLSEVIERGKREGEFDVTDSLSTIQFILSGQAVMLSNERFGWTEEELSDRVIATLTLVERALGAAPNSLVQRIATALNKRV